MNKPLVIGFCWAAACSLLLLTAARPLVAADAAFVGSLALAVEDKNAERIGLSDEVLEKLHDLIDRREREAFNIVLEIKDLPPVEIAARLAPFVKESERQGMSLLTLEQRETLEQLRIAQAGMQSLEDDAVVEVLGLSEEQRTAVRQLLDQLAADLTQGGDSQRRITRNLYERRLANVLTDDQRAAWRALAGLAVAAETPAPAPPVVPDAPAKPTTSEVVSTDAPADPPAETEPAAPGPDAPPAPAAAPDAPPAEAVAADSPSDQQGEPRLRFNFNYHPWEDVLDWFAEQADLSLQIDYPPPGTFNYKDTRYYSPSEAIDIMNRVLLTKGFTLLRTGRLLTLVNLEEEIPPQLVELVPVRELDDRGEFEIIKCLFQLAKWEPEEAAEEVGKLVGRGGSVTALPKASQILVTETAGKLREIRSVIEGVENPTGATAEIVPIVLEHASPEELLAIARPLLGLEEEQNTNDKIQIAVDAYSRRVFVTGERASVQRLQELVPLVDRPPGENEGPTLAVEQLQLATYQVKKADPTQVLQVTQTLMAGLPDVRLAIDPVTNKLIALARPSEHRMIAETLRQLEGDAERVEVISLRRMDPQLVILAIEKLFGTAAEGAEGPTVDGDPVAMKLWVRGTELQIEQVRDLVDKLEGPDPSAGEGIRGNVRFLPYSGLSAQNALRNAELIWGSMRPNTIRMVTPSAISSAIRERVPAGSLDAENGDGHDPGLDVPPTGPRDSSGAFPLPGTRRPLELPRNSDPALDDARHQRAPTEPRNDLTATDLTFVSQSEPPDESEGDEPQPNGEPLEQAGAAESNDEDAAANDAPAGAAGAHDVPTGAQASAEESRDPQSGSNDIVVSVTPNGLVIASKDAAALDEFESLVRTLMDSSSIAPQEPTVFWLKYAKADVAAEILTRVLTGTSSTGGGSLVGDVATSMLGDVGGGLLGSLLGGADSLIPSGAPSIVPDVRLNALFVQASPNDLVLIERLLPVIDREAGPASVETGGKPRLIPVIFMTAEEMATIVRQVYADRIASAGGERQRQPSPEDFLRALRGGGGGGRGGGGGGGDVQQEIAKMTIGVDARSNSLIVAAPEPLFREVEELVAQLDQQGLESDDDVVVVTIRQSNPEAVHRALEAIVGESMQSSGTSGGTSSSSSSTPSQPNNAGSDEDAARRRIEFFRALQERGGFQGRPTGGSGFGSGFGGRGGADGGFGRGGGGGGDGGFGRGGRGGGR